MRKRQSSARHYARGANFERLVAEDLRTRGCFVVRSAGSHGVADLVAIRGGVAWLVQACATSGRKTARELWELRQEASECGARAILAEGRRKGAPKEGGAVSYLPVLGALP